MKKATFDSIDEYNQYCGVSQNPKPEPAQKIWSFIRVPAAIAAISILILVWKMFSYRSLAISRLNLLQTQLKKA